MFVIVTILTHIFFLLIVVFVPIRYMGLLIFQLYQPVCDGLYASEARCTNPTLGIHVTNCLVTRIGESKALCWLVIVQSGLWFECVPAKSI